MSLAVPLSRAHQAAVRLRRAGWRPTAETALIVAAFPVLAFLLPHGLRGDDWTRYADVRQLLDHGRLTDSRYSVVMPLASAPFVLLGRGVGDPVGWAARVNLLFVGAGVLAAYFTLRHRVDQSVFRHTVLVLLCLSFLVYQVRGYGAEVFTATAVAVGILLVATQQRVRLGWGLVVVGVTNTPAAIFGLLIVCAWLAVRRRRLRLLLPVAATVVLIGMEAWIRRGSPFTTGYAGDHGLRTVLPYSGRPGFSYPFLLGIASILFAFGRGLMFYAPGLWLGLSSTVRRLARSSANTLMLLFLGGLVLGYAKWWGWNGGLTPVPRFFLLATVPASYLLAVRLRSARTVFDHCVALVLLAFSGWVAVCCVVADQTQLAFCAQHGYQAEFLCWYVPDFSSLWWPVLHFPQLSSSQVAVLGFLALVFLYLAQPIVTDLVARGRRADIAHWLAGWRV